MKHTKEPDYKIIYIQNKLPVTLSCSQKEASLEN